jgi:diguanylate cyclase (GGDEF)-like protein/PAS domain S-box-containing protein
VLIGAAGASLGCAALGVTVLVTASIVATVSGSLYGVWLLRLAARHRAQGHRDAVAAPLALAGAVVLAGACAAVLPSAPRLAALAVLPAGLAVTGMLALSSVAPDGPGALSRCLDGLCVAVWKFLTVWIVIIEPRGGVRTKAFVTCLLACVGLTIALVSGVRARYPRGTPLAAAAGTAAVVFGLAVLALLPAGGRAREGWLLGAGAALTAGCGLLWTGARRTVPEARSAGSFATPPVPDRTLAGDPLLVAPVLAGSAAVVYGFVVTGRLTITSLSIGVAAIGAVVLREMLEALRTRAFTGQLAAQEAHFRSLVAGSTDLIVLLHPDLSVRWQSPSAARLFGLSDQEVTGRPFRALVHPDDVDRVVARLGSCGVDGARAAENPVGARLSDGYGVWRPIEFTVRDLSGTPEVGALVMHLRDVTDRTELANALRHNACTDALTGLANRAELLAELASGTAEGTLLTIGLDGFAGINDVHGPEVGDAMLVEVARRIRTTVGADDLIARLAGDEFAVLTPADDVRAFTLASRLSGELSEAYRLPGAVLHLSAGIGLACVPSPDGVDETVRRSGVAMRRAKRAGRGRVEWHDDAVEAAYVRRAVLEQALPDAVGRGQLDLSYQPVYDLVEGHPVGVEALLRWRHPNVGTVGPREAMAVAHELGMTGEVHEWVLYRACRQLSRWQRDGYRLWMSVNVSFEDLLAPGFDARLSLALDAHQLEPADLVVELAERELDAGRQLVVAPLAGVRALGVRTALDGFGTGATSLAHLRALPADLLKIDRSLFAEPPGMTGSVAPLVDVVVDLARRLDIIVIAHGLESESHRAVVRTAGCRYGQGYLYGYPAPAERIEAQLVHQRTL